jgi:hypothetical protein
VPAWCGDAGGMIWQKSAGVSGFDATGTSVLRTGVQRCGGGASRRHLCYHFTCMPMRVMRGCSNVDGCMYDDVR